MLEIQILVKKIDGLDECISSVIPLKSKIKIFNLTDNYIKNSINLKFQGDWSEIRNKLIKDSTENWILYLDSNEVLSDHNEILNLINISPNAYNFRIYQNGLINKEIRLFNKNLNLKFINPVFETIYKPSCPHASTIIYKKSIDEDIDEIIKIINKWKNLNPISSDPYYYHAFAMLLKKDYKNYLNMANHYLFKEQSGISVAMTKYHCAMIELYLNNNIKSSISHLLPCLAENPLMAEFWCLLGDIFYKIKDYNKSKIFYENAILLGSQRRIDDEWTLEINKYKNYPNKMIESCNKILKNSFIIA